MSFESVGSNAVDAVSPGGFYFGIQGWVWGAPVPKVVTFFLDGSALLRDQYGRVIRKSTRLEGGELLFADCAPPSTRGLGDFREGPIQPRTQFATHKQVIECLKDEGIDWLSYEVRWLAPGNRRESRGNLTMERAQEVQRQVIKSGRTTVVLARTLTCAGWPQLTYEELVKLPELPPTPVEELLKIPNLTLRRDAVRARRERDEAKRKQSEGSEPATAPTP